MLRDALQAREIGLSFVVYPDHRELLREEPIGSEMRDGLVEAVRSLGFVALDPTPQMIRAAHRAGDRPWTLPMDSHLSVHGHRTIAGWLLEQAPWALD